jgi:hypothetical protein
MSEDFQPPVNLQQENPVTQPESLMIEPAAIDNALLSRLLAEVKAESENRLHAYNRQHNRHNRGR